MSISYTDFLIHGIMIDLQRLLSSDYSDQEKERQLLYVLMRYLYRTLDEKGEQGEEGK